MGQNSTNQGSETTNQRDRHADASDFKGFFGSIAAAGNLQPLRKSKQLCRSEDREEQSCQEVGGAFPEAISRHAADDLRVATCIPNRGL